MHHAELGERAEALLDEAPRGDRSAWRRALDANATALAAMTRCETDRDLERRLAAVVWSCVVEPGDTDAGTIVEALGVVPAARILLGTDALGTFRRALASGDRSVEAATRGADTALTAEGGRLEKALSRWAPRARFDRIGELVHAGTQSGARVLTVDDPEWPHALDDLGRAAPHVLWVRGNRSLTALAAVAASAAAIVGSRAATSYGLEVAIDLADGLAREGLAIVSGGAYGVDIAAHRAALARDASTVAVLAGGADRLYPPGNVGVLQRIIATGGAIVAELPCGQAPTRWRFLQRNRLIAAMSTATFVVEAGRRSGALNTAGHASELGRPVGAVPGPITSAASMGCHNLIRDYDATLITCIDDALELVRGLEAAAATLPGLEREATLDGPGGGETSGDGDRGRTVAGRPLTGDAARVWDALSVRARQTVVDLAERAGIAESVVRGTLAMLELEGRASGESGRWRRAAG